MCLLIKYLHKPPGPAPFTSFPIPCISSTKLPDRLTSVSLLTLWRYHGSLHLSVGVLGWFGELSWVVAGCVCACVCVCDVDETVDPEGPFPDDLRPSLNNIWMSSEV